MSEPVDVVVPVRNGERFLRDALASVLAQGHEPLDVVVVDDGSTDGTPGVAASVGPPVRVLSQRASGIGAAVNRGIAETHAGLVAFLDADDLWTGGRLARQLAELRARPELDAVFGHVVQFAGDPATAGRAPEPGYFRGSMLIRRHALDRAGPFATDLRLGEFVEWYARAVDRGVTTAVVPEVVLLRRIHDDNLGVRMRDEQVEWTRVVKAVLDRRREQRA